MMLLRVIFVNVVVWLALIGGTRTFAPYADGVGVISYIMQDGARRDLYLTDISRGVRYPLLTNFTQHGRYDWSPDGTQLVYAERGKVQVFDLFTREFRVIAEVNGNFVHLDWSPDGGRILYGFSGEAHIYDIATGESAALGNRIISPSWNADGTGLIYASIPPDGRLFVADITGENIRPITNAPAGMPNASPDGRAVVYVQANELMVLDYATGERQVLTDTAHPSLSPKWSADGRYIVFSRLWQNVQDVRGVLYVLDMQTGQEHALRLPGQFNLDPVWLPD